MNYHGSFSLSIEKHSIGDNDDGKVKNIVALLRLKASVNVKIIHFFRLKKFQYSSGTKL